MREKITSCTENSDEVVECNQTSPNDFSVNNMEGIITNHTENSNDVDVQNIEDAQNNQITQKDSSVLNMNSVIDTDERLPSHKENSDNGDAQNIKDIQNNQIIYTEETIINHAENSDGQNNLTFSNVASVLSVNSLNNEEDTVTNHTENSDSVNVQNIKDIQNNQTDLSVPSVNFINETRQKTEGKTTNSNNTVTVITALKPLCADYRSDSDSESIDSESDSTTDSSSEDEDTSDDSYDSDENEKEKKHERKKLTKDLSLSDLPPIEDLKISVSENECVEVGKISSIVETLVVVESYKGSAALDLDTVLFLDHGKRTLGRVFDILGPITEPVYAVRFNSEEQIKNLNIEKNLKVYYAPKTQHTTFVFMSEVLKNRGSDASWKDNIEAPPEFQDFSDDEQERIHKNKQVRGTAGENQSLREANKSMKRPYSKVNPRSEVFQAGGYRNPNFCWQRRPNIQRNPMVPLPRPPNVFDPTQTPSYPYNVPPYPSVNPVSNHPRVCFPPRFSGPPFPVSGSFPLYNQNQNFQHPFYQQRTHGYPCQTVGSWARPTMPPMIRYQIPPPPPPPPPSSGEQVVSTLQDHQQS